MKEEVMIATGYKSIWFENVEFMNKSVGEAYRLNKDDSEKLESLTQLKRAFAVGFALISKRWASYFKGNHDFGNLDYANFGRYFPVFKKYGFTDAETDEVITLLKNLRNATMHLHARFADDDFTVPAKLGYVFASVASDMSGDCEIYEIQGYGNTPNRFYWRTAENRLTVFGMLLTAVCFLRQHERETVINYLCGLDRKYKGNVVKALSVPQRTKLIDVAPFPALIDDFNSGDKIKETKNKFYERWVLQDLLLLSLESEKIILRANSLLNNEDGYISYREILCKTDLPEKIIKALNNLRVTVAHGYPLDSKFGGGTVTPARLVDTMLTLYDYFCDKEEYSSIADLTKEFCGRLISHKYLNMYLNDISAKNGYNNRFPEGCFVRNNAGDDKKKFYSYGREKLFKVYIKNMCTVTPEVEQKIFDKFGLDLMLVPPTEDLKEQFAAVTGLRYFNVAEKRQFRYEEYVVNKNYSRLYADRFVAQDGHLEVEEGTGWEVVAEDISPDAAFERWHKTVIMDCVYGKITVCTAVYRDRDGNEIITPANRGIRFPRLKNFYV